MLLAAFMAMAMQAPAAGGAATPAASSGTLETFKSLCVANKSDIGQAVRQAEARNWSAPPDGAMGNFPPGLSQMKNVQVRMLRTPQNTGYFLLTGNDADFLGTGHPGHNAACILVGANLGAVDDTATADMKRWMGEEGGFADGSSLVYAYTEKDGRRTYISKDQDKEAKEAFDSGKLNIVALVSQGPVKLMIYIVPTQAN
jgi:hypothetical protein